MADFGFSAMAPEEPGRLALVGPNDTEAAAADCLVQARSRSSTGSRALGCARATPSPSYLGGCVEE